jgi:hypothetical protein
MKKQKTEKQNKHPGRKKNLALMLLAILAAILCVIMPDKMMDRQTRAQADVYMDVPEEYYPTSSYYEVTKASSEKLSEYQKRQLISGRWESEITDVDKEYYEDSGYHIEEMTKELINTLESKNLYPVGIESAYSDWYNWKCTYMQALDTNFRSYAGFFWRVEFTHYENAEKLVVYITPEGRIIESMYYSENEGREKDLSFSDEFNDGMVRRLAGLMLGDGMVVQDLINTTNTEMDELYSFILEDKLIKKEDELWQELKNEKGTEESSEESSETAAEEGTSEGTPPDDEYMLIKKITVAENESDDTVQYFFYIYHDGSRLIEGFLPVD